MLKKLRLKFVLVSTMLVVLVIASISFGLIISNISNKKNTIYQSLYVYRDFITKNSNARADSKFVIIKLYDNGMDEYSSIEGTLFENVDYLKSLVNNIQKRNKEKGSIGNVFYISYNEVGCKVIILGDFSVETSIFKHNILMTVTLNIIGCILIAVIAWILSYWVVKPYEEVLSQQKRFIADAGHELKTPVAIIGTNLEVLQADTGKNEWTENIRSQTDRMNEIISELLDLTKIEEGNEKRNAVDFQLDKVLKTTVTQFDVLAYEKGKQIDIICSKDLHYKGNSDDFKKVISILLNNSIKYATNQTIIRVELKKDNKNYVLTVYNEGCDIDEKDKDKLFERFYRTDVSRDRETGGTGLGLAIAKATCDRNKWNISIDCKKNSYIKFIVTIKE